MRFVFIFIYLLACSFSINAQILNFDEYTGNHPKMLEIIENSELVELQPGDSYEFSLTVSTHLFYSLSSLDDLPNFITKNATGRDEFGSGVTVTYELQLSANAPEGTWLASVWLNSKSDGNVIDTNIKHFFIKIGDSEFPLPEYNVEFKEDYNNIYEANPIEGIVNLESDYYDYHPNNTLIDWGTAHSFKERGTNFWHRYMVYGNYQMEVIVLGPGGFKTFKIDFYVQKPIAGTFRGMELGYGKSVIKHIDGLYYYSEGPKRRGMIPRHSATVKSIYLDLTVIHAEDILMGALIDDDKYFQLSSDKGSRMFSFRQDFYEKIDGFDFHSYELELLLENTNSLSLEYDVNYYHLFKNKVNEYFALLADASTTNKGQFANNSDLVKIDITNGNTEKIFSDIGIRAIMDIYDNFIYYKSGSLLKVNKFGTILWELQLNKGCNTTPAIGLDGRIYLSTQDYSDKSSELNCISPEGELLWEVEVNSPDVYAGDEITSPVIDRLGNIYVGVGQSDYLCSFSREGNLNWKVNVDCRETPIIGSGGIIYVPGWNRIAAVSFLGEVLWEYIGNKRYLSLFIEDNILLANTLGEGVDFINIESSGLQKSAWPANMNNNYRSRKLEHELDEYIVPSFSADTVEGIQPLTVDFKNSSTGNYTSLLWDFGDGNTSSEINPSHQYEKTGNFDVTLTLYSDLGVVYKKKVEHISLRDTLKAIFDAPSLEGIAPFTVKFNNNSTGNITHRLWDFGDDRTSTWISPTHTYQQPGQYDVMLKIKGPDGIDSTIKKEYITVLHRPPTAVFISDTTYGYDSLLVNFSDLSSDSIVTWFWDFGDGAASELQNPSHLYTNIGTYDVSLIVNGPGGADTTTQKEFITIESTTGIEDEIIPEEFNLFQNFPNPFNPSTMIKYSVPELSKVKVEIFNMIGQSVGLIVNSERAAGVYEHIWDAGNLPSGVYLINILATGVGSNKHFKEVKKAVLIK